jgi:hypothetical protein
MLHDMAEPHTCTYLLGHVCVCRGPAPACWEGGESCAESKGQHCGSSRQGRCQPIPGEHHDAAGAGQQWGSALCEPELQISWQRG